MMNGLPCEVTTECHYKVIGFNVIDVSALSLSQALVYFLLQTLNQLFLHTALWKVLFLFNEK